VPRTRIQDYIPDPAAQAIDEEGEEGEEEQYGADDDGGQENG